MMWWWRLRAGNGRLQLLRVATSSGGREVWVEDVSWGRHRGGWRVGKGGNFNIEGALSTYMHNVLKGERVTKQDEGERGGRGRRENGEETLVREKEASSPRCSLEFHTLSIGRIGVDTD